MLPIPRPVLLLLSAASALGLSSAAAATASATTIRDVAQPLSIIGNATKPACSSPTAPFETNDYLALGAVDGNLDGGDPLPTAGVGYAAFGAAFVPTVVVCSPTFNDIPAPFSGTTKERLPRTQLGRGWRAIGSTLLTPSPLRSGDTLTIPELDDAAVLRAAISGADASAATTVSFTDLAPGPITLSVATDARGVVATLRRGDSTQDERVVTPTQPPALRPSLSVSGRKLTITTRHTPGTQVALTEAYGDRTVYTSADAQGVSRVSFKLSRRALRRPTPYLLFAANPSTLELSIVNCETNRGRRGRVTTIGCGGGLDFFSRLARTATRALRGAPAQRPAQAARPSRQRSSAAARARVANPVPLQARQVPRTTETRERQPYDVVPLAADVNGDGATDFWADDGGRGGTLNVLDTESPGTLLISTPNGLQAVDLLRTDVADGEDSWSGDSEISAIDDITGDGIGELVIDLGERQAIVPGSKTWGTGTRRVAIPNPADLDADDLLLAPSVSSPGAPYAALDDVTGDGRHELAATDDYGTWQAIPSSALIPGRVQRIGMAARAVPTPGALLRTRESSSTAPRFDPRGRVIGGQLIGLAWPKIATRKDPVGTVRITVRDALGRDVVPPATTSVPGNALLLDHDRRSGDTLLLGVNVPCTTRSRSSRERGRCRQAIVRVRADGSIRQTITLPGGVSATAAPQTARFLPDGPDADSDVEVLLTTDGTTLNVAGSSLTGTVTAGQLGSAASRLITADRLSYDGLRFYTVVRPDGQRRVYAFISPARSYGRQQIPVEISW